MKSFFNPLECPGCQRGLDHGSVSAVHQRGGGGGGRVFTYTCRECGCLMDVLPRSAMWFEVVGYHVMREPEIADATADLGKIMARHFNNARTQIEKAVWADDPDEPATESQRRSAEFWNMVVENENFMDEVFRPIVLPLPTGTKKWPMAGRVYDGITGWLPAPLVAITGPDVIGDEFDRWLRDTMEAATAKAMTAEGLEAPPPSYISELSTWSPWPAGSKVNNPLPPGPYKVRNYYGVAPAGLRNLPLHDPVPPLGGMTGTEASARTGWVDAIGATVAEKMRKIYADPFSPEHHTDTVAGAWWEFKQAWRRFWRAGFCAVAGFGELAIEKTHALAGWCWRNWVPLVLIMASAWWLSGLPADAADDFRAIEYSWTPGVGGTAVVHYDVWRRVNSGDWLFAGVTDGAVATWGFDAALGDTFQIRVRGVDAAARAGPWSESSDPWVSELGIGEPGKPYRIDMK